MQRILETDKSLQELYMAHSFGSGGILVEHNSIDSMLQKNYIKNILAIKSLPKQILL